MQQIIPRILLVVVTFGVLLAVMQPMRLIYLRQGLDFSWIAALGEAHTLGLRFGSDVVFTGGPLSPLITRYFQEDIVFLVVLVAWSIALVLALALSHVLGKARPLAAYAVLALVAAVRPMLDTLFYAIPFLVAYVALARPERRSGGLVVVGLTLGAAAVVAKFSILVPVIGCALVLDAVAVAYRRMPFHLLLVLVSVVAWFMLAGGNPGDIAEFARSSIEVAQGYGAAMPLTGPWYEVGAWAFCAALLLAVLAVDATREGNGLLVGWARFAIHAIFLSIAWKTGFVRHDSHAFIAWSALMLTLAIYLARPGPMPRWRLAACGVAMALAVTFGNPQRASNLVPQLDVPTMVHTSLSQIENGARMLSHPEAWLEDHRRNKAASFAAVKDVSPLPALDGTADMIPSLQSHLIGNGISYRPRPTIQEYSTYSHALVERNRSFFVSERAPKYLLFAPGSIDGRHPASAEGGLWPLFLSRYEPVDRVKLYYPTGAANEMLVLRLRQAPIPAVMGEQRHFVTALMEYFAIPSHSEPLFIQLDIQLTPAGRLLELGFKAPLLMLDVSYSDGTHQTYRLIAPMARVGFVISPLVDNIDATFDLFAGRYSDRRAVRLRVRGGFLSGMSFARRVNVSIAPIASDVLRAAAQENGFARQLQP